MKLVTALIALAAVAALSTPAMASTHHTRMNCGWPHPDPACFATPPVRPAPTPASTTPATPSTQDIFSGLLNFQQEVITGLQQADTTQAAVLNPVTGAAWEPDIHICLNGMPAVGTPGQPGYIPGNTGLIGWVQSLTAPSVAAIPPLPANPSPATVAVHVQIIADAALYDVNNVVSQINAGGFPKFLQTDCGGVLAHVQANINTVVGQVAAFDALLAKYVMPVVAAHKHS